MRNGLDPLVRVSAGIAPSQVDSFGSSTAELKLMVE